MLDNGTGVWLHACSHARKLIYQRFIKFVNSLFDTKRSTRIVPGRTKQSDLQDYTVYQVPEEELWRLSILESLMEIRSDNWSVIFNEEEEEEDDLEENDIEAMIYEACTT